MMQDNDDDVSTLRRCVFNYHYFMSAFERYFSQFTTCCRESTYYDDILRMFHTYRTILLHTGKLEFKLRTNEERDPEAIQAIREYVDEVTDSFTFFFDRANDWEPKLRSLKGFVRRSVTCEREFDMRGMNFETAAFLPVSLYLFLLFICVKILPRVNKRKGKKRGELVRRKLKKAPFLFFMTIIIAIIVFFFFTIAAILSLLHPYLYYYDY
eukprot:Rmarinus@m.11130